MCRMFGLVAQQPVAARALLREAPRSLHTLSREHPDGWGVAVRSPDEWIVHRGTEPAQGSARFSEVAASATARLVIAHVRQKTVGCTALVNTHPFHRGAFVFAHNGSVTAIPALVAMTSQTRSEEITGDTDSERLFAFILTRIDEAGDIEVGLATAVRELHALGDIGATTFLLSCGTRLYAHRLGRSLFTLTRHGGADSRRTATVALASERLTDEPWHELPERALVVVDEATRGLRDLAL